jgi:hypothetical protein
VTPRQYAVALLGEAARLVRPVRDLTRRSTSVRITHRAHVGRRHAVPVATTRQDRTALGTVVAALLWCLANLTFWVTVLGTPGVLYEMGV